MLYKIEALQLTLFDLEHLYRFLPLLKHALQLNLVTADRYTFVLYS